MGRVKRQTNFNSNENIQFNTAMMVIYHICIYQHPQKVLYQEKTLSQPCCKVFKGARSHMIYHSVQTLALVG